MTNGTRRRTFFKPINTPPDHPARDMQDTFYLSDRCYPRLGGHAPNTSRLSTMTGIFVIARGGLRD
ncbi:MAG: hypothetical protein AB4352_03155 [Hormoscilla sp.]